MEELKYKDITEKIIGCAFEVHKFLGNGFQEIIYQRALAYETAANRSTVRS
jgi:GxxExxY protein